MTEILASATEISDAIMSGTITDFIGKNYINHARVHASKDLIALRKRNENLFTVTEEELLQSTNSNRRISLTLTKQLLIM